MQRNQEVMEDNLQFPISIIPSTGNVGIILSVNLQQYDWNSASPTLLAVLADEASRRMSLSSLSQDITLDPKFIEGPIDVESKF